MMRQHLSRRRLSLSLLALLAGVLLPPALLASVRDQPLRSRWLPAKPARTLLAAGQAPDAIEVKFVEGSALRVRGGQLTAPEGSALGGISAVLREYPVLVVERLFSQNEEEFARERGALEAWIGEELPDLNLWCRLKIAPGTDIEALTDALNALPEVELAYPAPQPAPPPGAAPVGAQETLAPAWPEPPSPNYVSRQGYLNAAPGGIAAGAAWARPGGNGSHATIVDVEYSFNAGHEDLPPIPVIGGAMYHGFGDDHGTAVLGELAGMNNAYGVRGIAAAAGIKFSAACATSACSAYLPAEAVNRARLATTPGDVILIEQQTTVCGSGYGPLEGIPSVYDAIRTATAARRVVVEAAGNGGVDLDQAGCANAFNRTVRDSGAIIVGAGAPPGYSQLDRSRLRYSSYGSRVDLQGWGALVTTAGYGYLYAGTGVNQWYTSSFAGTSSASPIVSGAAALLSSIARQRGTVLSPARIRSLLATTGSPQQEAPGYPRSQRIGPRPDLGRALVELERPTLRSPAGSTADRTPTYVWTKVPGATSYDLAVFRGATRVVSRVWAGTVCAATTCSVTAARILDLAPHTWKVRAAVGSWKTWSASKSFTVDP